MAEPEPMRQDNHGGTNFQNNISGGQVNQAQTINIYGSAALPSGEANPFGVPYQRNRFFTGREQILADLHGQLTTSGSTAITQIQAISGLGGIGKTQTAVEYAYRHFQDQPTYSHVFWVKADTEVNLNSDFAQLAVQLALPAAQGKEEEKLAAVKAWLANHDGWLLVFDNADEPEWLTPLMPTNPRGKVLLTSRATIFDEVGIRSPLALDVLSLAESLELIFERTGRSRSEEAVAAATELNGELDGLPLALEQASAFMLRKRVGLTTYLKTYRKAGLTQLEKVKAKTGSYPSSVVKTWALNMQAVGAEAPAAAELLTFSAFLAPDAIPYRILMVGAEKLNEVLQEALQGEDADEQRLALSELLEPLSQYSLVRWEPEREGYSVHRLVQAVVRDGLEQDEKVWWIERAIEAIRRAYPGSEFKHWPTCVELLPHWLSIAGQALHQQLQSEALGTLLTQAGFYLHTQGHYQEAELLYTDAFSICQAELSEHHPKTASSLNNLAALYRAQGRYQEAEPLFIKTLKIRIAVLGEHHPDTASSLNNLADLYRSQGHYQEAEPLFIETLKIRIAVHGKHHPDTAQSLNNLALLYNSQGRYQEAEPLYIEALVIRKAVLGERHPDTAASLNNLAMNYDYQGHYQEAEPLCLEALALRKAVLGERHPDTAASLNNLAMNYNVQGRYQEAEPLLRETLITCKAVLGECHPDTATSLDNLAMNYNSQGRYQEAEPLYIEALSIRKAIFDELHPDIASSLNNLSALYYNQNRFAEAAEMMSGVITILEEILPHHPNTKTARENLKAIQQKINK